MISHVLSEWPFRGAMLWAACMMLYMDYSLSHGHPGTRPCSPDQREAAGPVRLVVDRVLSFVITEQSPFALLVASSAGHPVPTGQWNIWHDQQTLDSCKAKLCEQPQQYV